MTKSPEHRFQIQAVSALRWNGVTTVDCDVMSGLQFLPTNTPKRYGFVNFHKAAGYTVGQPDLILLLKDGETLLVELKDGKKGKQSDEQKYFEFKVLGLGHNYVVWRSMDDVLEFIKGYKTMILKGGLDGSAKDDNKRAFDLNERLASQEQADGRQGNN